MLDFFKNPLKYLSAEARAKRARDGQLHEIWKKEAPGMTFEAFMRKDEQKGEQSRKWNEIYKRKRQERTQRCIAAMQTILRLAPHTTPKSSSKHLLQLVNAIEKVRWIGSKIDFSDDPHADIQDGPVVEELHPTLEGHVEEVGKHLWILRRHPNSQLSRAADEVLDKLVFRYDHVARISPEIFAEYRPRSATRNLSRNWGMYKPHEVE